MNPPEGPDRPAIAKHLTQGPIPTVLPRSQPVTMFNAGRPAADRSLPRIHPVVDADIVSQYVTAPAIMISGDHDHGDSRFAQVRERREDAEPGARNHRLPLEPELEQIAVDDDGASRCPQVFQEAQDLIVDRRRGKSKMGVREDVSRGGKHDGESTRPAGLYKAPLPP